MDLKRTVKTLFSWVLGRLYRGKIVVLAGPPRFNGFCSIKANMQLGNNVHFNGFKALGSGTIFIGDNFHSGYGLMFLTSNHNYNGNALPYDFTVIRKDTVISDNVWVGINVLFLPGVKVGEGAIIQAGSVVSKSIPSFAIAGGNPAEVIKYRDQEHYACLKKDGKFV